MSVDLKARPFYLSDEDVKWVEDTLQAMTLDEKVGQLFINMGASRDKDYLVGVMNDYHIAGVRYNKGKASEVYEQNRILQEYSKVPMLIAANTEAGGDGACTDGTYVGHEVKIAATNDSHYAYEMGRIAGVEAAAIGCNWSFAPIVDINRNWRNPIISIRTFCDDPDQTLELAVQYMKGIRESGIAPAAKHFPGDGIDEFDQHLSFSVLSYSVEEWMDTFGKVYKGLIDHDLPSLMAGHISFPAWVRKVKPDATTQEAILPATVNKYIMTDLLRDELGFNGVVVTDASHMVPMTASMKRQDFVPAAIAAGVDLFLFFNDPDEDFGWMKQGVENGVISEERLHDAIRRTLGLKAMLGLHNKARNEILPEKEVAMAKIGLPENQAVALEVADKAITLVKNQQNLLPLAPAKYKRVLLVDVKGHEGGFGAMISSAGRPTDKIKALLEAEGFEVTIWESLMDRIAKMPKEEQAGAIANVYAQKRPIAELSKNYDLIINVAKVVPNTDQRVQWPASKGTPDIPFYVWEVPTIFISVLCPFHLADVPQVQTYINTYDDKDFTMKALVEKLVGRSEFKGVSPVDAFCGMECTRY